MTRYIVHWNSDGAKFVHWTVPCLQKKRLITLWVPYANKLATLTQCCTCWKPCACLVFNGTLCLAVTTWVRLPPVCHNFTLTTLLAVLLCQIVRLATNPTFVFFCQFFWTRSSVVQTEFKRARRLVKNFYVKIIFCFHPLIQSGTWAVKISVSFLFSNLCLSKYASIEVTGKKNSMKNTKMIKTFFPLILVMFVCGTCE